MCQSSRLYLTILVQLPLKENQTHLLDSITLGTSNAAAAAAAANLLTASSLSSSATRPDATERAAVEVRGGRVLQVQRMLNLYGYIQ